MTLVQAGIYVFIIYIYIPNITTIASLSVIYVYIHQLSTYHLFISFIHPSYTHSYHSMQALLSLNIALFSERKVPLIDDFQTGGIIYPIIYPIIVTEPNIMTSDYHLTSDLMISKQKLTANLWYEKRRLCIFKVKVLLTKN